MIIRKAEEKDVERLYEMLRQVQQIHALGRPDIFKAGTNKYDRNAIRELLNKKDYSVFVADDGGVAIGYAFCEIQRTENQENLNDIKAYYIDDLCVDENYRGKGIGKELYDYVLGVAKKEKCYHLTLNVWNLNPTAVKFYQKLGMQTLKMTMEEIIK